MNVTDRKDVLCFICLVVSMDSSATINGCSIVKISRRGWRFVMNGRCGITNYGRSVDGDLSTPVTVVDSVTICLICTMLVRQAGVFDIGVVSSFICNQLTSLFSCVHANGVIISHFSGRGMISTVISVYL